jgi:hypothetical protein
MTVTQSRDEGHGTPCGQVQADDAASATHPVSARIACEQLGNQRRIRCAGQTAETAVPASALFAFFGFPQQLMGYACPPRNTAVVLISSEL